jgi:hypothetical protein
LPRPVLERRRRRPRHVWIRRPFGDRRGEDAPDLFRRTAVLRSIKNEFFVRACSRCGGDVPMSEMFMAMDSGLCGWCEHMIDKD